jgi:hypothetical protein
MEADVEALIGTGRYARSRERTSDATVIVTTRSTSVYKSDDTDECNRFGLDRLLAACRSMQIDRTASCPRHPIERAPSARQTCSTHWRDDR